MDAARYPCLASIASMTASSVAPVASANSATGWVAAELLHQSARGVPQLLEVELLHAATGAPPTPCRK